MKCLRGGLWSAVFIVGGLPALADDGYSAFRNGTLEFGKSETIVMADEKLTISASEIVADFHFC